MRRRVGSPLLKAHKILCATSTVTFVTFKFSLYSTTKGTVFGPAAFWRFKKVHNKKLGHVGLTFQWLRPTTLFGSCYKFLVEAAINGFTSSNQAFDRIY